MVIVIIVPEVSEALVATVAGFVEFVLVVPGLLAVDSVMVNVMLQPVLPFVDVPAARGDVIVVRARHRRGSEKQNSACQSCRQRRVR
jgi:hypothetical protein